MNSLHKIYLLSLLCVSFLTSAGVERLKIPEGFEIEVYAENIENPRQMARGEKFLFVGSRAAGKIHAVDLADPSKVSILFENLSMPTGVTMYDGDLYIAEVNTIKVVRDIEKLIHTKESLNLETFFDAMPRKKYNTMKQNWHGWKWLAVGPDGALYFNEGAPCNTCVEADQRVSTILRLEDNELSVYARGVRNSVGFDWHPETGQMYFTDNGRDMLGDDIPPCELNRVSFAGEHFGFPFIHGTDVEDPGFKATENFNFTPPAWEFGAHTAPLGIEFYSHSQFPETYHGGLFVVQRGSWNRSSKVGYKVLYLTLDAGEIINSEVFVEGWLEGEESWGRPAAPHILDDGSLLISDDTSNQIFRVSYKG